MSQPKSEGESAKSVFPAGADSEDQSTTPTCAHCAGFPVMKACAGLLLLLQGKHPSLAIRQLPAKLLATPRNGGPALRIESSGFGLPQREEAPRSRRNAPVKEQPFESPALGFPELNCQRKPLPGRCREALGPDERNLPRQTAPMELTIESPPVDAQKTQLPLMYDLLMSNAGIPEFEGLERPGVMLQSRSHCAHGLHVLAVLPPRLEAELEPSALPTTADLQNERVQCPALPRLTSPKSKRLGLPAPSKPSQHFATAPQQVQTSPPAAHDSREH
mmetsp:Transcript_16243/g.61888  ORF Transcript_16243/g.61888 Transcript_16243/m.61888 type:complete len:275 (+) Transcript_16243:2250-3074(+)|eukprot:scaffold1378_cov257-Pinguiococcus_pyrenoidosus.AAC.5